MSRLEAALRGIASELGRRGRAFAVVGGLAVSARAEPRFTRDVDLALAVVDDADAEALVPGLPVPVARTGDLTRAMKVLSNGPQRPQDQIDIVALLRLADEAEMGRAREAAALIVARGFGRGRDLLGLLGEHLRALS